ncbi:unnamed protein product [Lactuca saligna]|uniref:Uncharacterized protein n=1 Tax=Lactuca saligna TaxID=75948 RepID=A0AA36EP84_LACSI|nr:unnamed protein product [Lactuca saligna]
MKPYEDSQVSRVLEIDPSSITPHDDLSSPRPYVISFMYRGAPKNEIRRNLDTYPLLFVSSVVVYLEDDDVPTRKDVDTYLLLFVSLIITAPSITHVATVNYRN